MIDHQCSLARLGVVKLKGGVTSSIIMSLIGFSRGREERERGNRLFTEKKYEEALGCYSAAIVSENVCFFLYDHYCILYKIIILIVLMVDTSLDSVVQVVV